MTVGQIPSCIVINNNCIDDDETCGGLAGAQFDDADDLLDERIMPFDRRENNIFLFL